MAGLFGRSGKPPLPEGPAFLSDSKGLQSGLSSAARPRSDAPQGRQSVKNLPQARKGKKKKKKKKRREAASKTDFRHTAQPPRARAARHAPCPKPFFPEGKGTDGQGGAIPTGLFPGAAISWKQTALGRHCARMERGRDGIRNTEGWRFTEGPLRKAALFACVFTPARGRQGRLPLVMSRLRLFFRFFSPRHFRLQPHDPPP